MKTTALDISAAHPLYLYVVFVVCVVAALALLVGASISRRNSSWRRQMQLQAHAPTVRGTGTAYPVEPVAEPEPVAEQLTLPAKRTASRKTTATKTAARKTTATKKTTAATKKTAAKKPQ